MTRLLYKNEIDTISTDSLSTDDESNLIAPESWKTWVGSNEASTTISGVFDNPSSPGVQKLVDAVAVVHNLPLDSKATVKLYDGGNTPGDLVHTSTDNQMMLSLSAEGIFHSVELDSNGHLKEDNRAWQLYIYYPPSGIVATELDIVFTYSSSINPIFRWIYAGPMIQTATCAERSQTPQVFDFTRSTLSNAGNIHSCVGPQKNAIEFAWPRVTGPERLRMEQARLYFNTGLPVILDLYGENDYRSHYDRIWGKMVEPINIQRRISSQDDLYRATCLISEH